MKQAAIEIFSDQNSSVINDHFSLKYQVVKHFA